jgi:hypothetical protein
MDLRGALLGTLLMGALGLGGTCALAQGASPEHPVLVELFTSEGCSSCPPADEVLRKMHDMHTQAGTLIVTLSEHVTYWNHDGWTDPFSDQIFTDRQSAYEERLKVSEAYTPQVVVMGSAQLNGTDGYNILKAVDAAKSAAVTLQIEPPKVDGKKAEVTFSVAGALPKKGADVFAVVTDDEATTNVLRGENKGVTITHVSVARSLVKVATIKDTVSHTATVTLPVSSGGHHLVLIAQEPGVGKVLAIESKAL